MKSSRFAAIDGRWVLLGIILSYFLLLLLSNLFGDYYYFWRYLGVPTIKPTFADLTHITNGWDCIRLGYNIRIDNPCNGGPMTYPYPWLMLTGLGLGKSHTVVLAVLIILFFFASALLLLPRLRIAEVWIYATVACSPAVMLAVDRGNIDMIMFSLCALAVFLLSKQRASMAYVAYGTILLAGFLKFYPVAAIVVSLREGKKRGLTIFFLLVWAFIGYLAITYEDFTAVRGIIPEPPNWAYGAKTLALQFSGTLAKLQGLDAQALVTPIYMGAVAIGLLLSYIGAWWTSHKADHLAYDPARREFLGFQVGASVYVFSYMVASNFNYRLVFWLMVMPQILEWLRTDNRRQWLHRTALIALVASTWVGFFFLAVYHSAIKTIINLSLDQILEWIVFTYLLYALFATGPLWLRCWIGLGGASRAPAESLPIR